MPKSRERHPTVAAAIVQILDRACSEAAGLRRDERVLYTVAEFWAAVRAHELAAHLEACPESRLLAAEVAFGEIGAFRVSDKLQRALHRLRADPFSHKLLRKIVRNLERELVATNDPVDRLLVELAAECDSNTRAPQQQIPAVTGDDRKPTPIE